MFKSMEQGRTFRISMPKLPTKDPNHRILAHQRSRFTHYYFYIRDEVLGPIVLRVASFFPFHATYWLNGHSFIEQELNRTHIGFHKSDNAFLAVDDVAALQAAADRLSPQIIRKRLDYWTFLLGPKFSKRERSQMNLSRFYSMAQIEYCRNFIFKRHFPIHKIFERGCEIGLWRLTANRISEIFGVRRTKKLRGKPSSNRSSTAIMSFVRTGKTPYSDNTRSSPASCATSCARTIWATSVSAKAWITSTPCGKSFKPSPTASPTFRRSASTCTCTFPYFSGSLSPSPSARSAIPA